MTPEEGQEAKVAAVAEVIKPTEAGLSGSERVCVAVSERVCV
jgi:hypothetical protein